MVWATLEIIIGGRVGWDLFYGTILCSVSPDTAFCGGLPSTFLTNPVKLIAVWEGGMSFHGGVIGLAIAIWLFCRRRQAQPVQHRAILSPAWRQSASRSSESPISSMANCGAVRQTCHGRWSSRARRTRLPRHPSQLYECFLEGIVLLALVQFCFRVLRWHERPGLIAATFFTGYGLFRFFVEFFREPDAPFFGWFTMGMALCVPLIAAGMLALCDRSVATAAIPRGMNALASRIARQIELDGPMSVAQYMTMALHDPFAGYYQHARRLAREGDFITAPEISQMFGELLGVWMRADVAQIRARPPRLAWSSSVPAAAP